MANQVNHTRAPEGSAHSGVHHWWAQRLSALMLVPLSIWFVASLIRMPFSNYDRLLVWMSGTFTTVALLIMTVSALYHAALGLQVVFEDYVHHKRIQMICIMVTKFVFLFLGIIAVLSLGKIYMLLG